MTNLKGLKKPATKGKGDLPERGQKSAVIQADPRPNETKAPKKPLQFMVDEDTFNDFSSKAAAMFGHKKGAKTLYFQYLIGKS